MFLHTYVMFFVHLKYYDIEGSLWCNIFSPGRIELWSFFSKKKKRHYEIKISVFSKEQLKNEFSVSLHLCKAQSAKIGKIVQQVPILITSIG